MALFLEDHGYQYGPLFSNLMLLQPYFSVETLHRIVIAALMTPSPDMALNAFERLAGVVPAGDLAEVAFRRKRLSQFVLVCGSSPFLVNLIFKTPSAFRWLFLENGIDISRSTNEMLSTLQAQSDEQADFVALMKLLRCFKRSEILRIAARDLNGLAPLKRLLPSFRVWLLPLCRWLTVGRRCLIREFGVPMMQTDSGPRPAEMTILGMGNSVAMS